MGLMHLSLELMALIITRPIKDKYFEYETDIFKGIHDLKEKIDKIKSFRTTQREK